MSDSQKTDERRLDALILNAFESACATGDMEVAEALHFALKKVFSRSQEAGWTGEERRADPEVLIDAFRKLERMFLRNADDVNFQNESNKASNIVCKPSSNTVH